MAIFYGYKEGNNCLLKHHLTTSSYCLVVIIHEVLLGHLIMLYL